MSSTIPPGATAFGARQGFCKCRSGRQRGKSGPGDSIGGRRWQRSKRRKGYGKEERQGRGEEARPRPALSGVGVQDVAGTGDEGGVGQT